MIKRYIRRFVDWMERSPTYKTIWFFPLLVTLALVAWVINTIKRTKGYIHTK